MIEFDSASSESSGKLGQRVSPSIQVKVLGIGGAGCNILSRLNSQISPRMEFIALNTDRESLRRCKVKKKLQLGNSVTRGWGTGGDANLAKQIALEERDSIEGVLEGVDLTLLVSGLGKGTGTGVSPVISQIAKEMGSLTVGFFVLPFSFEGERRISQARKGLEELEKVVDAVMIVPNDDLLRDADENFSLKDSFKRIDNILGETIEAMDNLLFCPGLIDLNFADIKAFLERKGRLGVSVSRGSGRMAAQGVAKNALSVIEEGSLSKVEGILLHIRGGENLSLMDVEKAVSLIRKSIPSQAEIIFGASVDHNLSKETVLTLMVMGGEMPLKMEEKSEGKIEQEEFDLKAYRSDDLDIPTFLRKRKN